MASGKYTSECREGKRRLKFKFFSHSMLEHERRLKIKKEK